MRLIYRQIHRINTFIYCADNIPDHRSRRFGCCPCQMAVRTFGLPQNKSRIRAATQIRQVQNEPLSQAIPSAFLSYHNRLYKAS